MHESLNTRLTHSATSIFRNPDIQTLVKNYRHWFAQTLICKNALNSQSQGLALPSLNEVCGPIKGKKNSQNEYSQNTTQFSQNDNNATSDDFGGNIQKTQIFRINAQDFTIDLKIDSHLDFDEFKNQVIVKKNEVSSELRFADIDRIVIQEKGEQFYAEKKFSKSRQWLEQVQDEYRREELKMQIEYFQVGSKSNKFDSHFETMWQREEREKQQKKFVGGGYRSRRIVGYTLGYTASSIKEKLIKMLDSTKTNQVTFQDYANKHISRATKSVSPTKGRPRSNSQENLLQLSNMEDSKSQLLDHGIDGREPLSQFVQHQMPVFHDDDTQSEQDSMENAIEQHLQIEREAVPDRVFDGMPALGYSMYKSYLQWFQQNDISHESYIKKQLERDFEEEARVEEALRLKKEIESKRFSFRLVEKNKSKIEEDVQMSDEEQNQIIEQRPEILEKQRSESPILNQRSEILNNLDSFGNSLIKQEQSEHQLELEQSEQEEFEVKEESGKMSPVVQFKLPKDEELPKKHLKEESGKASPKRFNLAKEESETKNPKDESQKSSPKRNLKTKEESQKTFPLIVLPKEESSEKVSPKQSSPDLKFSPVFQESSEKSSPVLDSQPEFETPVKPIIELNMGLSPPKPLHTMSTGEKAMWDIEVQFKEMQEEMERNRRKMIEMFEQKKKAAMQIKEEEDRKQREIIENARIEKERLEKERIEKERLEKERLEKERLEKERLEKERREKERLEKERREKERQERDRLEKLRLQQEKERMMRERLEKERLVNERALMKQREQFELTLMLQEDLSTQTFYQEERHQIHLQQERIRIEGEIKMEQERMQRMQEDRERQEEMQRQEVQRLEKEKKQRVQEALASQAKVSKEALEAEKRRRMAMLQEEERLRQQKLQLQESENDWEEGQQQSSGSVSSDDINKLNKDRDDYVNNMNKKYGTTLNQEIRRMETKDMTRRKIKKVENEDKLYDFVKIKNIKQEKIEQQRKQLENSSSHSQPSKDSKESSKKAVQEQPEDSSEKLSSSKSDGEAEADLNQYDLFDNKNEEELPEIDDESMSVQEITQSQLESPTKVTQIETYPKKEENNKIQELSAQIALLQEQLGMAVQSIKILSSQSQLKDAQKPSNPDTQLEEDDEEYHLPAFGSQVSPPKKKIVEPFNLGKRNYSQFEEEQQYRAYEKEYSNSPTKKEQFQNLTEFVDYKKMESHKTDIQQQHVQREQNRRNMVQQKRQGPSQSQPRSSSAGSSQSQGVQRQRERSTSGERMRPPQQEQPSVNQQRPQQSHQNQRPPQQQQQHQQQQQFRQPQHQQQRSNRDTQGQGQAPRQRSGSPVKQPQHQQQMGMNVAGNKRYVHSQNPNGQNPGQIYRSKMQQQGPSQNYNHDTQILKRRKIAHVIEDDDDQDQ